MTRIQEGGLTCPKCDTRLSVTGVKEVVIDHCKSCSGLWFDKGELEAIVKKGGDDEVRSLSVAEAGEVDDEGRTWKSVWFDENEGGCPRCRTPMMRVESAGKKDLFVDACPRCEGIWYDGGEVDLLLRDGDPPGLVSRIKQLIRGKK